MIDDCKRWSPVLAGVVLGLIMVLTFYVSGRGIGASGGITRIVAVTQNWVAPEVTANSEYFSKYFVDGANPLDDYLVYMLLGILLGAFVAALVGNDLRVHILRGPSASPGLRLVLALGGGLLVGFAARLARGCTSGLALVGGAELAVGSWAFMMAIFAGGFAAAYFVRRQWL